MPATRKSSGGRRSSSGTAAGGGARQSTLSFNHRVTKAVPKSAKDAVAHPHRPVKPSPLSRSATGRDLVKKEEEEEEEGGLEDEIVVKVKREADVEEQRDEEGEDEEEEELPVKPEPVAVKSDAELRAERISDAQVGRYWRGIEAQRIAHRVHQEDLSVSEKVLRYFDVSSQYGPCVGITRMRRWMRADRLGLNPPIEVLAVLLKEEARGTEGIERAYMDELMNPTPVEA